jgi:hypothetical protein
MFSPRTQRQPAQGIEHGRDHAAVRVAIDVVADEVGLHREAHPNVAFVQRVDLETDALIEQVD